MRDKGFGHIKYTNKILIRCKEGQGRVYGARGTSNESQKN